MITINKAILRGHLLITLPVLLILFGLPFLYSILATKHILQLYQKNILIISSFFVAWLYWSFFIVKWKLWAYKNVKELDELKLIAVKQGLIWKNGSVFEKTEIKSKKEKQELRNYEANFHNEDIKNEVAIDGRIFISKRKAAISSIVFLLLMLFGFIILIISEKSILLILFGIITVIPFGYLCFKSLKDLLNNTPELIFSENGIELKENFYQWQEISNLKITQEFQGRYSTEINYLTFEHSSKSEKISINYLDTNVIHLEKLISKFYKH